MKNSQEIQLLMVQLFGRWLKGEVQCISLHSATLQSQMQMNVRSLQSSGTPELS